MRDVPVALRAHLDTGQTTLAWCWKITRKDGTVLGFTNHDRTLTFGGVDYEASTGMLGSEAESNLGLSVDNMEVQGAVESDRITEQDLVGGKYDDADIELILVNWADTSQRLVMKVGNLGEVTRGKTLFQAELRGLAQKMQQSRGRLFSYQCDADFGDSRCKINATTSTFKGSGTVDSTNGSSTIIATGLNAYADQWFTRGKLTFTSGLNNGLSFEVKLHRFTSGVCALTLWVPAVFTIAETDTFDIIAGCDKLFSTCVEKFNNAVNFRGFPHMPGNSFVVLYANRGDKNMDGNGLFGPSGGAPA